VKQYKKSQYLKRKEEIKDGFADELSVFIGHPTSWGNGNSLTGNVCRRIFNTIKISSKILKVEVEEEILENVLQVIKRKNKIKSDEFQEFCDSIYRSILSKYP
jgi:hypothetical protein